MSSALVVREVSSGIIRGRWRLSSEYKCFSFSFVVWGELVAPPVRKIFSPPEAQWNKQRPGIASKTAAQQDRNRQTNHYSLYLYFLLLSL